MTQSVRFFPPTRQSVPLHACVQRHSLPSRSSPPATWTIHAPPFMLCLYSLEVRQRQPCLHAALQCGFRAPCWTWAGWCACSRAARASRRPARGARRAAHSPTCPPRWHRGGPPEARLHAEHTIAALQLHCTPHMWKTVQSFHASGSPRFICFTRVAQCVTRGALPQCLRSSR